MIDFIESIYKPVLKEKGFRKKQLNWWLEKGGLIWVVNVQKSLYGEQYYLNIGAEPVELAETEFPVEYKCGFRARIDSICELNDVQRNSLDFEKLVPEEERKKAWLEMLNQFLQLIEKISCLEDLRIWIELNGEGCLVTLTMKNHLDVKKGSS
jgi:hypothetical protein